MEPYRLEVMWVVKVDSLFSWIKWTKYTYIRWKPNFNPILLFLHVWRKWSLLPISGRGILTSHPAKCLAINEVTMLFSTSTVGQQDRGMNKEMCGPIAARTFNMHGNPYSQCQSAEDAVMASLSLSHSSFAPKKEDWCMYVVCASVSLPLSQQRPPPWWIFQPIFISSAVSWDDVEIWSGSRTCPSLYILYIYRMRIRQHSFPLAEILKISGVAHYLKYL